MKSSIVLEKPVVPSYVINCLPFTFLALKQGMTNLLETANILGFTNHMRFCPFVFFTF